VGISHRLPPRDESNQVTETPKDRIVPILGRIPSGIFVLTAKHGQQQTGMLASWVMQSGFDPPTITVAVKKGRYVADWLKAGTPFALNVVAEEGKSLLAHFGRGFEPDENAFEDLVMERAAEDVPVLADETIGYLLCRPGECLDSGDHHIFLAEVIDGQMTRDAVPMLHVRKSGAHY
jgi:flavin reductase (DIM6/NTAB) family NADH-FMN oxidoreductase RutF